MHMQGSVVLNLTPEIKDGMLRRGIIRARSQNLLQEVKKGEPKGPHRFWSYNTKDGGTRGKKCHHKHWGSIQALWIAEVQSSSVNRADGASSPVQAQARQSRSLGGDHPNSVGAADPCDPAPCFPLFDAAAPQQAHHVSGRLYGQASTASFPSISTPSLWLSATATVLPAVTTIPIPSAGTPDPLQLQLRAMLLLEPIAEGEHTPALDACPPTPRFFLHLMC
ncbi:hypothetical protein DFH08DRAFT_806946 [Mycena albidolilacea]|uniref:Uncharacterized protein n=1 Tax=Mycena albidolilacea TaxID=1033008 RepID=A0AAD7A4V1_9AGAR|nr:hypothetical protein DFH08DRAFT_806946 [Mycena albidolilacea]